MNVLLALMTQVMDQRIKSSRYVRLLIKRTRQFPTERLVKKLETIRGKENNLRTSTGIEPTTPGFD